MDINNKENTLNYPEIRSFKKQVEISGRTFYICVEQKDTFWIYGVYDEKLNLFCMDTMYNTTLDDVYETIMKEIAEHLEY